MFFDFFLRRLCIFFFKRGKFVKLPIKKGGQKLCRPSFLYYFLMGSLALFRCGNEIYFGQTFRYVYNLRREIKLFMDDRNNAARARRNVRETVKSERIGHGVAHVSAAVGQCHDGFRDAAPVCVQNSAADGNARGGRREDIQLKTFCAGDDFRRKKIERREFFGKARSRTRIDCLHGEVESSGLRRRAVDSARRAVERKTRRQLRAVHEGEAVSATPPDTLKNNS